MMDDDQVRSLEDLGISDPTPPAVHALRVASLCWSFYIVCLCGWVSLAYKSREGALHAMRYGCTMDLAEQERTTNRAELKQRLADETRP